MKVKIKPLNFWLLLALLLPGNVFAQKDDSKPEIKAVVDQHIFADDHREESMWSALYGAKSIKNKVNTEVQKKNVEIQVKASMELGKFPHSELYNNNSLLRVPRKEVTDKYLEKFGKAKIMRCWLTLDDCWNYKTGEISYNFPVGWGFNLWSNYYDYIDRFSDISEEILLNIRGNHGYVINGEMSMKEWREVCKSAIVHYKKRCPNIKYIEALNEYDGHGFGGLSNDQYYLFYKEFYEIVNEINQEINPEIPLLVGGPCIMGGSLESDAANSKKSKMLAFLDNYSSDKSPHKKVDFISYHQYNDTKENPSTALHHEALIDSWLKDRGISTDLPIFINEMGCFPGAAKHGCVDEDLFITACNVASLMYYYDHQSDMYGFHWVVQHKTNERKNQILDDLRWTPYGISMLMTGMHGSNKIQAVSNGIVDGLGVYAQASKSDSSVILQTWNYQWTNNETLQADIYFTGLPNFGKKLIITQYLLDEVNNNFLNSESYYWNSDPNEDIKTFRSDTVAYSENKKLNLTLKPNNMAVIKISGVNHKK